MRQIGNERREGCEEVPLGGIGEVDFTKAVTGTKVQGTTTLRTVGNSSGEVFLCDRRIRRRGPAVWMP